MPAVVARHPEALYLIAGQTHPEVLRRHGEEYRNKLIGIVESLGLDDNVAFVNQYLPQKDLIEFLLASDIYVTPYLDPNQITSGTLSYALGAGKAVVSTPYLHAKEALADDRGILVDFRSPERLADAINGCSTTRVEGPAGAQRLRVRERVHVAEDGCAVAPDVGGPRGSVPSVRPRARVPAGRWPCRSRRAWPRTP